MLCLTNLTNLCFTAFPVLSYLAVAKGTFAKKFIESPKSYPLGNTRFSFLGINVVDRLLKKKTGEFFKPHETVSSMEDLRLFEEVKDTNLLMSAQKSELMKKLQP